MGSMEQEPVKMAHGVGEIGRITPTGAPGSTGVPMGPTGGVDSGTAMTPMTAGVGSIPVKGKPSSVPSAPIDGLHNVGPIDGKTMGSPTESGMEANLHRAGGMTYDYPGL